MAHCRDLTAHCGDAIGMLNFYRRFIPRATHLLKPLTDALKGKPQKQLLWTSDMKTAFTNSKEALCNMATLAHPDQAAEVFLAVEASDSHVGAVLQQQTRGAAQSHSDSSQRSWILHSRITKVGHPFFSKERSVLCILLGSL